MPLVVENEQVEAAHKIFGAAAKIVKIIEESGLPDGAPKAAIIRAVAISYNMEAHSLKE